VSLRVVVTGAGGFLGKRVVQSLLDMAELDIDGTRREIAEVVACDVTRPLLPEDPRIHLVVGDIADPLFAEEVIGPGTGAVLHLAAVVSGAAESDFDLGMRTNLNGTRTLLEACRGASGPVRFVFASSVAVYGGGLSGVISEATAPAPQTSYGMQKAIGELLVCDYSRRGYVDGRALRLPTIAVRGDAPNTAVTSFVSDIVRDPVRGAEAVCPVAADTAVWILSPRRVVEAFILAVELPARVWTEGRVVALPGSTVTAAEIVAVLRVMEGELVADRVRWEIDPFIDAVVSSFPVAIDTSYGDRLGFRADVDTAAIIRDFLEDEQAADR